MSRRKFIGISMERAIHIFLNSRTASSRLLSYPGFGSINFLGLCQINFDCLRPLVCFLIHFIQFRPYFLSLQCIFDTISELTFSRSLYYLLLFYLSEVLFGGFAKTLLNCTFNIYLMWMSSWPAQMESCSSWCTDT